MITVCSKKVVSYCGSLYCGDGRRMYFVRTLGMSAQLSCIFFKRRIIYFCRTHILFLLEHAKVSIPQPNFLFRDHSYITSALKGGGRGVGQMLIFADEGGRGGIG